jgi:hypoxanthine phosphoribosyltransferase/transcriptional regulator with XRE-family HTH domain
MTSRHKRRLPPTVNQILMRSQRDLLGVTQDRLAELLDVDSKYLGRVERGQKRASGDLARRIDQRLREMWAAREDLSASGLEYRTILAIHDSGPGLEADSDRKHAEGKGTGSLTGSAKKSRIGLPESGRPDVSSGRSGTRGRAAHGLETMSWDEYYEAVLELSEQVMANPVYGGFRPDAVIGVNPGGAIVGALLYLINRRAFYFATIWSKGDVVDELPNGLRGLSRLCDEKKDGPARILLVDDSMKTGTVMRTAVELVRRALGPRTAEIRSAVLVYLERYNNVDDGFRPDYMIDTDCAAFPYSPV